MRQRAVKRVLRSLSAGIAGYYTILEIDRAEQTQFHRDDECVSPRNLLKSNHRAAFVKGRAEHGDSWARLAAKSG
jgi:hypothetical protein